MNAEEAVVYARMFAGMLGYALGDKVKQEHFLEEDGTSRKIKIIEDQWSTIGHIDTDTGTAKMYRARFSVAIMGGRTYFLMAAGQEQEDVREGGKGLHFWEVTRPHLN